MSDTAPSTLWSPPLASLASRSPKADKTFSVTGTFVDDRTGREFFYESGFERDLAMILLTDPRIRRVREQPPKVRYVDDAGATRWHTFDLICETTDGMRIAIAVKPEALLASSGIERIVELIRAAPPSGFADKFVVRTDRHISRARAADARMILRARRTRDDADVRRVDAFVRTIRGSVPIRAICGAVADVPHAFMRIVNLIDEGRLKRIGSGRLTTGSIVAPAFIDTKMGEG